MLEFRIPRAFFDLEAMLKQTVEFLQERVASEIPPTMMMFILHERKNLPGPGPKSIREVRSVLEEKGWIIFFPFAYSNEFRVLECADGRKYDQESSDEGFSFYPEHSLGFTVQISDGHVMVEATMIDGEERLVPVPFADLSEDLAGLYEAMGNYIGKFLRS